MFKVASQTRGCSVHRKIEKVLLFRSPLVYHQHVGHEDPHPPLELLYIAASLKQDYEVMILDGQRQTDRVEDFGEQKRIGLDDAQIAREAVAFEPDLIGISIMWHHQIPAAIYFAGLLKKNLADVFIVAGGVGPSSSPEILLESPHLDFVISGDGENALVELCQALSEGAELSTVPGLSFRDGGTVSSIAKKNIAHIDEISFPAFEMVNLLDYKSGYQHGHHKAFPMSGILPSRGCPLACHFCSLPAVSNQLFRTHSVERVVSDMLRMRDEFGVREIHFYDDNVVNNRPFSKRLFKAMVEQNVGLPWLPEAGFALWKIDEETLALAKASGMYRLDLPIETASDRVRGDIMDKGLYHNEGVSAIVKTARKVGIEKIFGYVIAGSPGETIEDMKQTLDFVNALDLDYRGVRYAQPFPGTQFYRICVEKGYLAADFSLDRLWFTIPNIETKDFTIDEVTTLIEADRAAAMIRQRVAGYREAVREIKTKHSTRIAEDAAVLIPDLQRRYQTRVGKQQVNT